MTALLATRPHIAPMSEAAIDKVRRLESLAAALPQVAIETDHVLHAGLYARTVFVPKGVMITGALIKIATLLIVSGEATVSVDGGTLALRGYTVLPAGAGRKQAFVARTDMHLTMIFPTDATTVEDAEREFTDEADLLLSRHDTSHPHP
jgi:hypothetical protein